MDIHIFYTTNKIIKEGDIIDKNDIVYNVKITNDIGSESDKILRGSFDTYDSMVQWLSTTLLTIKLDFTGTCTSILHKDFTVK